MNNIKQFLADYFDIDGFYTILDNGVIDVDGDVFLKHRQFNLDGFT